MDRYLLSLDQFHKAVGDKPSKFIAGNTIAKLRSRLIREESKEACAELELPFSSEEALLKELCDILYVVFGTVWAYNLPIEQAFDRVHVNNMLKTSYPRDEFGKLTKPNDHPRVYLQDLLEERDGK